MTYGDWKSDNEETDDSLLLFSAIVFGIPVVVVIGVLILWLVT